MVKEKRCTQCGISKNLFLFAKNKKAADGLQNTCKECQKQWKIKYRKTIKGVIDVIYNSQKQSSKRRKHKPPAYTKDQLYEFAISSNIFIQIFDSWASLGYQKILKPSFDRLDDSKGYSFSNFNKWMTWQENRDKGHSDMRSGKLSSGTPHRSVIQMTTNGVFIAKFVSQKEALRLTGIADSSICKVVNGNRKTAGGFIWI